MQNEVADAISWAEATLVAAAPWFEASGRCCQCRGLAAKIDEWVAHGVMRDAPRSWKPPLGGRDVLNLRVTNAL